MSRQAEGGEQSSVRRATVAKRMRSLCSEWMKRIERGD